MAVPSGVPFVHLAIYSKAERREIRPFSQFLMDRLEDVEFLDDTEGDDVLTLTFRNEDMALWDSAETRFGRHIAFTFGWTGRGEISQRRICTVETFKGEGDRLKVVANPDHAMTDRGFLFMNFMKARPYRLPPPEPTNVMVPHVSEEGTENKLPRFEWRAMAQLRGGSFGAGNANISDPDFFKFIIRTIATENGFRDAEVVYEGDLPASIPDFNDEGWIIGRGDTAGPDVALTWMYILESAAALIGWTARIDNGLIILTPSDYVDRPAMEFVARGKPGIYSPEYQREIFDGSIDVKADILRMPAVIEARGYDVTGRRTWLAIADSVDASRQAAMMGNGAVSLAGESREVRHVETSAKTQAQANEDARTALVKGEEDATSLKCKVYGVPRITSGNLIMMTLPSRALSGVYKIKMARHRVRTPGGPYTTEYELIRRIIEKAGIDQDGDVKETESGVIRKAIELEEGGQYYKTYLNYGVQDKRGGVPFDPDRGPTQNIPKF